MKSLVMSMSDSMSNPVMDDKGVIIIGSYQTGPVNSPEESAL